MNKLINLVTISLVFTLFSSSVHARSCHRDEYDKAEYLAERAGRKLVDKYGGGSDIRVKVSSCSYNSYSEIFKTKIEVYWSGLFFSSNKYNIDGELKMNSEGGAAKFSETYANSAVDDIRFWGYVAGGVVVLGAVAAESQ